MTLFHDLKEANLEVWQSYTRHEFIRKLADESLELAAFQRYLIQDYHFLIHFARAYGLAVYKQTTLEGIQHSMDGLKNIVWETGLHTSMTAEWGISPEELNATPEDLGTVAYTRYVIDTAVTGTLLDLYVSLSPCLIGYAEIGAEIAHVLEDNPDHPYRQWIETYIDPQFVKASEEEIKNLDTLAGEGPLSEQRFAELSRIFATASRLEAEFWQQAL
ncbi:TenA family protein [Nesterenkonia lacusekhoensis]|uniref:TenA family protein n=2 Tax=Nesterenkonia TaxID=57494 RepID=A0ABU2DRX8_9MICC|nr:MULTISPECIES: TenA family protein [Nesterenkonia]MBP2319502.1 thiaminase/transcriptional activator TenA [Nesterenkonia lacusekhoensis]MDR8019229.1 TenA family protein [Nesterenkonia sp. LY-0111]